MTRFIQSEHKVIFKFIHEWLPLQATIMSKALPSITFLPHVNQKACPHLEQQVIWTKLHDVQQADGHSMQWLQH